MDNTYIHKGRTFGKKEKLCSQIAIDSLFSQSESFISYPLRVVYIIKDESDIQNQLAKIMVSVSKKKFKRAVKRNRIKRLIREAYRLNKASLAMHLQNKGKGMNIAFLYLNNELPKYEDIEKAMLKAIKIILQKMEGSGQ